MSEGRWFPWKEQPMDIRPHPDYVKELRKPLKPPPPGLEWRRLDDGMWELRRSIRPGPDSVALAAAEASGCVEAAGTVGGAPGSEDRERNVSGEKEPEAEKEPEPEQRMPEFLEHVVMPEDTMTGICMRYKVKPRELRRLNDFVGDHFRLCATLIVPNRLFATSKSIQVLQPPPRSVLLQKFRNLSFLSLAEAKFYMEEAEWDVDRALGLWRADRDWELEQAPRKEESEQSKTAAADRVAKKRRQWGRQSSRVAPFTAVSGTGSTNFMVTDEGSIELRSRADVLADARTPLLSGR